MIERLRPSLALCCAALLCAACSESDRSTAQADIAPSSLTVFPTAVPEGLPGELTQLQFKAALTDVQPFPVTISWRTEAISATAGEDYYDAAGEVLIPAGQLETLITVEVLGDAVPEPGETLRLRYSASANAAATAAVALGTIANDDVDCSAPYVKDHPNRWRVAPGDDPLNYAHRGGVIDFPENTLFAYGEVAALGADVLEMDVYQTADNELVIIHDLDVDRTTDGTGNVVDLSLAELKALDAAYWFVPGVGTPHDRPASDYVYRGIATGEKPPPPGYSRADFRIPTLREALQRFAPYLINVELKPDLDGVGDYERLIADELLRFGRVDDVIAASFVDQAANRFKAVAPCIHTSVPLDQGTALVLAGLGDGTIPAVPEHVAFQVPPDTSQISQIPDALFLEVVTADFVRDAHDANLAVQVWTVNECREMLDLIALGVDAIMTDRPVLLEELLNTPPPQRACSAAP